MTARPPLVALLAALVAALTLLLASAALASSFEPATLALLDVQQAEFGDASATGTELFGCAVALDGDTALVGAPWRTIDGTYEQGAVFVYTCSHGVWTQQGGPLFAADGDASDHFGLSVALDGDTALVGSSGGVFVFARSGGVWAAHGELVPTDAFSRDWYGYSVALDGDTALVGWPFATDATDDPGSLAGRAVAFRRSGGVWAQDGPALAGGLGDFGCSVALDGDTALVGDSASGRAFVFARSGGAWASEAVLSGSALEDYGSSVALDGDTALVGAPSYGPDTTGAVFTYGRRQGAWTQQGEPLTAADGGTYDGFGIAVALGGDTALVGALLHRDGSATSGRASSGGIASGAAYVFTRRPVTFTLNQTGPGQSALVRHAPSAGGELVPEELWRGALDASHARLASGDLDGDGWADAAIVSQDGRRFTVLAWLSSAPNALVSSPQFEVSFEAEVQIACGDVVHGLPHSGRAGPRPLRPRDGIVLYAERGSSSMILYLLYGGGSGAPRLLVREAASRAARAAGLWPPASAGPQLACADADGDGLLEPVTLSVPRPGRGRLDVWHYDPQSGFSRQTWWSGALPAGTRFAAGDVTGDGLGDAIVSAPDARYPVTLRVLVSRGASFGGPQYWNAHKTRTATLLALAAGDAHGNALADLALALALGRTQASLALSMTDPQLTSGELTFSYGYGLVSGLPLRIAVAPARATAGF